jgi:hypothetical protein
VQTRWAWGQEARSSLEILVAPREVPALWLPRLVVLLLLTWGVVTIIVLSFTILPLIVGRKLLQAAQIPDWLRHDPFCFMIGITLCWLVFLLMTKIFSRKCRKYVTSLGLIPRALYAKAAATLLGWLAIEISVGLIVQVLLSNSFTSFSILYHMNNKFLSADHLTAVKPNKLHLLHYLLSLRHIVSIYLKGAAVTSVFCALILYGHTDRIFNLLQLHIPDAAQVLLARQLGDHTIQNTNPVIQAAIGKLFDLRQPLL